MKKSLLIVSLLFLSVGLTFSFVHAQQQTSPTEQQEQGWYCPWMSLKAQGQSGWNCPGWSTGAGTGGMHRRCRGRMAVQYSPQPGAELSEKDAQALLQEYLKATNNPNLKLGNISNKEGFYEADILTKDGSLADKIQVNKGNGWFRSAY